MYVCVICSAKPTFLEVGGQPGFVTNMNTTNNDTLRINCNAEGEPIVQVQWLINGDPICESLPPLTLYIWWSSSVYCARASLSYVVLQRSDTKVCAQHQHRCVQASWGFYL